MLWWMWIHCIMAKHHEVWSHLHSSLINANAMFPMACIASRGYTMVSHLSTQQITNLIKFCVATGATCTYNTTNTTNKLYLINLYALFHTIKLLELPCLSAILLYTQLPKVLDPNIPNINFTPITIPFPTHIFSTFYD